MRANPWACLAATWAPSSGRISGGRLSRSSLVPLRPFGEPAQFRQPAGELGTSVDGVHRTYLDSGPGGLLPGALARHSSENSCSMSLAPAGRTRRPCAAAPWVSSRSSWARIRSPDMYRCPPCTRNDSRRSTPRPSVIASRDRRSSRQAPHLVSSFHTNKSAAGFSARKRRA
jgi:hypothetical protein